MNLSEEEKHLLESKDFDDFLRQLESDKVLSFFKLKDDNDLLNIIYDEFVLTEKEPDIELYLDYNLHMSHLKPEEVAYIDECTEEFAREEKQQRENFLMLKRINAPFPEDWVCHSLNKCPTVASLTSLRAQMIYFIKLLCDAPDSPDTRSSLTQNFADNCLKIIEKINHEQLRNDLYSFLKEHQLSDIIRWCHLVPEKEENLSNDNYLAIKQSVVHKLEGILEVKIDSGNSSASGVTQRRQVMAIIYLLDLVDKDLLGKVDNTKIAEFIHFLTGKAVSKSGIRGSNIYTYVNERFTLNGKMLYKDLLFIRDYFNGINFTSVVGKINKEIGNREKSKISGT